MIQLCTSYGIYLVYLESSEFNLHLKPTGDRPKAKLQTEV